MRVLVLYASQTGNSRQVAKQVSEEAAERGHDARVLGMEHFKKVDFAEEQVVVAVASSTGNGDCPDNGDKFYRFCRRKTTAPFLASCRFAVCALGDTNYDAFCSVGKEFDKHFERMGGTRMLKRVDVDEVEGIETFVEPWMERLWDALAALDAEVKSGAFGAPAASPPASASCDEPAQQPTGGGPTAAPVAPPERAAGHEDDEPLGSSAMRPLLAPVVRARWLTATSPSGGDGGGRALADEGPRRVLHVEVDVSAAGETMRFEPGDAMGVLPVNPAADVAALLTSLRLEEGAPLPATLRGGAMLPAHLEGCTSVGEALRERVDIGTISAWPPLPLLRLLHAHASPRPPTAATTTLGARVAAAVGSGAEGRAAHAALQRERPSLRELIDETRAAPSVEALLDALPPLAPRMYSVANAPELRAGAPNVIHLCLSIVRYVTTGPDGTRHARQGLASSMIESACQPLLAPHAAGGGGGAAVHLRVFRREPSGHELRLPESPATPLVLIGPGTGLAPFRAFIHHRRAKWTSAQLGPCHLFFGCRAPSVDFLYEQELTALSASGALRLHTAFSRAGEACSAGVWRGVRVGIPYVQDRLEEMGADLAALLTLEGDARVYVCGDGQSMASDVHAALRSTLVRHGGINMAEAEARLGALAERGRYAREIWN